ncbi:MAG: hypothetical protein Q8T13_14750 [Acidobacteriota bacterium]|nr:hypothetical protein [Acidobacteriota bacterium]
MRMDDKFVLDRYNYELQRKEHLNGSLTLPVALLTAIGGACLAMIRSFTFQEDPITTVFFLLIIAAGWALVYCVGLLFWTYHRQDYAYLPLLKDLDRWAEEDHDWRRYAEDNGADVAHEPDFATRLRTGMIDAADANTQKNDERSGWLHKARQSLIRAFVATALAAIPYALDQVRAQHVEQLNKAAGAAQTARPASAAPRRVPGQ